MTRINTNISALTANLNLANSNNSLQTTLTRLSTGLRINTAADNPSGMIAAADLGVDISNSNQAVSNSQAANQMISTADSALSQIQSLLTTIASLVTAAANTSAMSSSQIAANQLQIDSSLSAINNIAQTTSFQGQNLLNGNLAIQTSPGTNSGAIQNLNVTQVSLGTLSSMPVQINVTGLAKQAQISATVNDGLASDNVASGTLIFGDGGTLTVTAPIGSGASANGIQINFVESSTITPGTASAAFDGAANTLNITVSSSGVTTGKTIADAINNDTTFTATAGGASALGYTAGTDTRTDGNITVNTNDGGSLVIDSLMNGAGDTATVTINETATTPAGAPSVAYNTTTHVLTVNVNNDAKTSLANIATAINNYAETTGLKPFSATVATAGNFNTIVNLTNGIAPDGVGTSGTATTPSAFTFTGASGGTLVLDGIGGLNNGAQIVINEVSATTPSTAQWNASGNSGDGILTLNLAVNGGTGVGNVWSTTDINNLLAKATTPTGATVAAPFTAQAGATIAATGGAGDDITGAAPVAQTTPGVTGITTGFPTLGSALSGGLGIAGEIQGGTGTPGLTGKLDLQVSGNAGGQLFSFLPGAASTAAAMATALNVYSNATGVQAVAIGDQLLFNSVGYGSAAKVSVKIVNDGTTGGTFTSSLSAPNATGTDISATVNGIAATGQGNNVTLNTPGLGFSAALDPNMLTVGENVDFNVTGGGALFQLGPTVTPAEQYNLGLQSVDTSTLGGTVGRLYEIGSGYDASLTSNTAKAAQIIKAALDNVTSLRGQLGAFETATIDTNISTLNSAVTNLTAAQSSIQDADFATESANLSREQILVQSGTTVAGIASSTPANVLSLLQKAAQV